MFDSTNITPGEDRGTARRRSLRALHGTEDRSAAPGSPPDIVPWPGSRQGTGRIRRRDIQALLDELGVTKEIDDLDGPHPPGDIVAFPGPKPRS